MTGPLRRSLGRRRRLLVVSAVVLVAGGLASGLFAYFSGGATAGSAGGGAATSVAPGTPPTSVTSQPGRAVTISWAATALANGHPVDGYLVTRYDASPPYAPQITLAGCGGVVAALSCTETGVPFGSWQYTITPVIGANWRGTESTKSGTVTIGAGSLTLAQTTLGLAAFGSGSSPATLTGSLSGFASNEGITYRLDDSSSGTTLAGSPTTADSGGNASVSITLPRPADGSHSIFAVGNAAPYPSQASAAILVDTIPPTSSAGGVDAAWHASDVVVGLSAVDGVGGSGVNRITYQVDGGSTQTISGTSGNVTIPAPANGSNDGSHTIAFYATDDAGNVEAPAKTATVKIDATKPSTSLATTPASPDGTNGWFQQASVQFSLTGSDARSGVAQSFYTVDGGAAQTYSGVVTVSGQGTHTVTYWSVDNAGNTEAAKSAQIKLDNVKPSTSIAVSPAAPNGSGGWYVTTPSFTLSASDATSGVASTLYRIDSGATQTYSGAVSIPDGQHTITYWSVDSAGNTETATTTSTIKVDTVEPSTSIAISPASPDGSNGWRVSATSFTLGGSDAISGVASTFYKIDGGATQTYSGSAVSIPQGSHTVSYWSVDNAGNTESATTSPAIKVDTVKPSTTLTTAPATPDGSNNWFQRSSVTFTLAATDATSGVANSYYTIDGGAQQTYSGTVTVNTQGDHTVTYWSVDTAGNTEATATTHIKLDNVKPATTLTTSPASPDGTNSWFKQSSVTFTLAATDASSGTATTLYTIDGGAQQTYSGTVTVSGQGDHTVTYWSTDNAGNVETTNTTHIKLDNVKPATTLTTSPASPDGTNGWFKQSSVTFTLAGSDATSGVAGRYYTVDGGAQQTYGGTITVNTQGDHTVTYWSVDNAGNTETTNTTHIKLDNVAPANSLTLTNKTGSASYLSGSTVYYRGVTLGSFSIQNAVSDATSGPASSSFPALGGVSTLGWSHTAPDLKTTPAGGPYVSNPFSWGNNTTSSPTETVTGTDNAGNTAAAPLLTFTNDQTAPSTTDNTASIGSTCQNTNQTVTLTPTDAGSGVAASYYTIDGSTPTTSSSQGTSVALTTEGSFTIKYMSVDNVGNAEAPKTAGTVICIDKTAPAATNVALANGAGGTTGTADTRDTLTITYSEQLDASTFCSTWGNTTNPSITGNNAVIQIADTGTNDTLTITGVSGACAGTFHLGSIALGGNYVTGNRTYTGGQTRILWNRTAHTLQIRLGNSSGGTANAGIAAAKPTYTPDAALADLAGNLLNPSAFTAAAATRF